MWEMCFSYRKTVESDVYFASLLNTKSKISSVTVWMRTSDEDKLRTSHVLLFAPVSSVSKKHTGMPGNFPRHCGGLSNSLFFFPPNVTPLHPGRVSFFSSGSENLHRVEKVTWGTRYAITVSFTCDPEHAIADPALPAGNWAWRQLVDDKPAARIGGDGKNEWINQTCSRSSRHVALVIFTCRSVTTEEMAAHQWKCFSTF